MAFNPNREAGSTWSFLAPGTHGRIVSILDPDPKVKAALAAAIAKPTDKALRTKLINVVARATGNCIGLAILHQKLDPNDDVRSVYKAMKAGVEADVVTAIDADTNEQLGLKDPPASNDAKKGPVFAISRMTGRCVGQEAGSDIIGLVKKLVHL